MSAFSPPPHPLTAEQQRDTKLATVFAKPEYTINTATRMSIKFYEILDNDGKNCIIFNYYTDTDNREGIYINGLSKCALNTGTKLLTKIEEFARLANIKRIHLEDASVIEPCNGVRIKLYNLSILCTGQSWYNKHGYKSENHDAEVNHNRKLIQTSIVKYIKNNDYITLSNILTPDAEEPNVEGTVQEVFQQLKHYLLSNNCSHIENIEFIEYLTNIMEPYIVYNGELLGKEITTNGGTKRSRTKRKRKKSKKVARIQRKFASKKKLTLF